MKDLALLAALCLATEAENAEDASRHRVDLREQCFEQQQAFWDSDAPTKAMLCGRRAGKSTAAIPWVIEGAIAQKGTVNPFISVTRKHAKLNFWSMAKAQALASGVRHKVNEAELSIEFEGGGVFFLGGADKLSELEKYRGLKIGRAFVDECGVMPSGSLSYLLAEILEPATMDVQGQIGLGGTPGPTKQGEWFEITRVDSTRGIPTFRWTCVDNPHIAHATVWLTDLRKRRGWTEKTPKYRREYLGEWCEDPGEQVFPLGEHNYVDALPTRTDGGKQLDASRWMWTMGSDIGASPGKTTLGVVATHPDLVCAYIVHTEAHVEWLISAWVSRFRELRTGTKTAPPRFPGAVLVPDCGGMGKAHAVELQKHFGEAFTPAEKDRKASMVDITRDAVVGGRVKLLRGPATQALRDEWAVLGWEEDPRTGKRKVDADGTPYPNKNAEQHVSDAILYALRHAWTYRMEDAKGPPPPGSPEEEAARRLRFVQARMRQRKRERRRS